MNKSTADNLSTTQKYVSLCNDCHIEDENLLFQRCQYCFEIWWDEGKIKEMKNNGK